MRNSHRNSKKGDKMKPRCLGLYKIKRHLDKGVYQLKTLKGVLLKAADNQCRLKLYQTTTENFESVSKHVFNN